MKALGYTWRVLLNCAYLAIVLLVFNGLQGRRDACVIVAVLGLIYVSMRSSAIAHAIALVQMALGIDRQLVTIRHLLQRSAEEDDLVEQAATKKQISEAEETIHTLRIKLSIDGVFLLLIGLVCLVVLLHNLS
jgi:hypothetical protein